jgi:hypothetical protein
MSGVWGWFGGQSAQKRKDTPKNAILGLRSQLEMLQKRERHLQNQMDEQDAIARKNVSSNKNGKCFTSSCDSIAPLSRAWQIRNISSQIIIYKIVLADDLKQPPELLYDGRSNTNIPSNKPPHR